MNKTTLVERIVSWVGSASSLMVHTIAFILAFVIGISGVAPWDSVFLVLTTVVSLEAIYLAIFIQITVNRQAQSIREVEENIDEIQEDVEEISEDIEEMQEDVEEMSEDVEEMQENIEEMTEEEQEAEMLEKKHSANLEQLTADVKKLLLDLEALKNEKK